MHRLLVLLVGMFALAAPADALAFTFYDWSLTTQPTSVAVLGSTVYYTQAGSTKLGTASLGGVQGPAIEASVSESEPTSLLSARGNVYYIDRLLGYIMEYIPGRDRAFPSIGSVSGGTALAASPNGRVWVAQTGGRLGCFSDDGGSLTQNDIS